MLSGKHILLGVTGGIAAYKAAYLVRAFQQEGAIVRVVMTPSATRFVGVETFSALTGHEVGVHTFIGDDSTSSTLSSSSSSIPSTSTSSSAGKKSPLAKDSSYNQWTRHIQWGEWADWFVIAPCTANTIAKIAHGVSDNLLTATVLAARCPLLICPTMDGEMMESAATLDNLNTLEKRGIHIMEPESGYLASGLIGKGRLPETEAIVQKVDELMGALPGPLYGKKVIVTAGPTREYIDAVRFLSNPSSGKMGVAMAKAAMRLGGSVHLVHGPISIAFPEGIASYAVTSAQDMFEQVAELSPADVYIKAAAVSDFTPKTKVNHKVKKSSAQSSIELVPTPDILSWIGEHKNETAISIGFAMETERLEEQAESKRVHKNADWIIANSIGEDVPQQGFESDYNKVLLLGQGTSLEMEGPKEDLAMNLLRTIFSV